MRKAAGEKDEGMGTEPSSPSSSGTAATLVTAHGTYATQSAFTATPVAKEEKM